MPSRHDEDTFPSHPLPKTGEKACASATTAPPGLTGVGLGSAKAAAARIGNEVSHDQNVF